SSSDITSSESEYEEIDINDIYSYKSPKYKTLIDVVLEPSKRDTFNTPNDISSGGRPTDQFTDNESNELKNDFISNMLQSEPNDLPNDYTSGNSPTNTNNTTTTHDNMDEKPFIMSIHDRNLYSGDEVIYNINGDVPINTNINTTTNNTRNDSYSGIDLINDSLSGNKHIDIYDEMLKRKENELFGTQHHPKHIINSVAKETNSDPIHNQLDLFHKWLDRHRNMCEQWDTNNKKEELLDKLKEEWNKENNTNSGLTHISSNMPSDENSIKNVLNTDVSIQIDMDDPKPINEFTNMDTIID
ncbi:erythrocyte membrane protein 1, EMP1, exon 2, partial [Plasmodium reichenowi]